MTVSVKGLPAGLTLRGSGLVQGRPSRLGVHRVTVTARDPWVLRRAPPSPVGDPALAAARTGRRLLAG
ncbi:putative Ig domain-containing protein [Streptacidiphilus jiangxiensis]|uniref:putative Ig domain-containing protein n=1 Tax=Streptacidiphilus jiangxiensis TaxID=235985 RepID=UPI00094386FF|nr:putative Ig domain-containing protein [Streptacidiphilus jiangxiensis]